jgi:hypothetical protein
MDTAIAQLQAAFLKLFGVTLVHTETSAYEGPTFPPGRNDFLACGSYIGPAGPTQMYIGIGTMEIEAQGGAGGTGAADWSQYCWTVMRTLASQTQEAWLPTNPGYPYTELKPVQS